MPAVLPRFGCPGKNTFVLFNKILKEAGGATAAPVEFVRPVKVNLRTQFAATECR